MGSSSSSPPTVFEQIDELKNSLMNEDFITLDFIILEKKSDFENGAFVTSVSEFCKVAGEMLKSIDMNGTPDYYQEWEKNFSCKIDDDQLKVKFAEFFDATTKEERPKYHDILLTVIERLQKYMEIIEGVDGGHIAIDISLSAQQEFELAVQKFLDEGHFLPQNLKSLRQFDHSIIQLLNRILSARVAVVDKENAAPCKNQLDTYIFIWERLKKCIE